jgi:hypothetical protein
LLPAEAFTVAQIVQLGHPLAGQGRGTYTGGSLMVDALPQLEAHGEISSSAATPRRASEIRRRRAGGSRADAGGQTGLDLHVRVERDGDAHRRGARPAGCSMAAFDRTRHAFVSFNVSGLSFGLGFTGEASGIDSQHFVHEFFRAAKGGLTEGGESRGHR